MNGKNSSDKVAGTTGSDARSSVTGIDKTGSDRTGSDRTGSDKTTSKATASPPASSSSLRGDPGDPAGKSRRTSSPSVRAASAGGGGKGVSSSGYGSASSSGGYGGSYDTQSGGATYGTSAGGSDYGQVGSDYGEVGSTGDRWGARSDRSYAGREGTSSSGQYGSASYSSGSSSQSGASLSWGRASAALDDLARRVDLKGNMERHPFLMVGAAFGVGYLLGGGRWSSVLFGAGARAFVMPMVRDRLTRFAEGAFQGARGVQDQSSSPRVPSDYGPGKDKDTDAYKDAY